MCVYSIVSIGSYKLCGCPHRMSIKQRLNTEQPGMLKEIASKLSCMEAKDRDGPCRGAVQWPAHTVRSWNLTCYGTCPNCMEKESPWWLLAMVSQIHSLRISIVFLTMAVCILVHGSGIHRILGEALDGLWGSETCRYRLYEAFLISEPPDSLRHVVAGNAEGWYIRT